MILLIGGTSETAPLAEGLAAAGFEVLVSTATDVPLDVGNHPRIARRSGMLDADGLASLVLEKGIRAIVDASHPYATVLRAGAHKAADDLKIPYVTWVRPQIVDQDGSMLFASDHECAARIACSFGLPVLLAIGSRNLAPYAVEAGRAGVRLVARVLAQPGSIEACRKAGIDEQHIVTGRGPFSLDDNLAVIRKFAVGVIVTKDSGVAGGVQEKLEAARIAACKVVVVQRPKEHAEATFSSISDLIDAVSGLVGHLQAPGDQDGQEQDARER